MIINPQREKPTNRGDAGYFSGTVWQDPLVVAPEPSRVRVTRVSFEPGARTNWHTHPFGQTLHVLYGLGRVQVEGGPVCEIRAGDTVWIGAKEKHWHGATPTHAMVHLAIHEADSDGNYIAWLEPVTD